MVKVTVKVFNDSPQETIIIWESHSLKINLFLQTPYYHHQGSLWCRVALGPGPKPQPLLEGKGADLMRHEMSLYKH